MRLRDIVHLSLRTVASSRLRSFLTALGIAIGIAAVVLLTSIGQGIQRFVMAEFTQFGTNLIAVTPGKASTFGVSGAVINTVRPLTLEDADALERIADIEAVVPFVQGNAAIEWQGRSRRSYVFGADADLPVVWRSRVTLGRFLPADDSHSPRAFAVLGAKVRDELFGNANPLGARIRVGGERYRVVGVMEPKGQMLGFDLDDAVYIPIGKALELFDRESLMEVDLLYRAEADVDVVAERVRRLLVQRHGREDFTMITQEQMMDVLGSVLDVLTFAVGALGGISLLVGGVGILTIMTIAVTERTNEIGLLSALGATRSHIMWLFLAEATLLAAVGGVCGLALGAGGALLLGEAIPALPVHLSWHYALAAELLAAVIGILAGVLPARHAAGLDPVEALRAE
ncbi:MAG: ABC transporter permease [Gammaproteobacteria bacterium]